jgi:hypothetical protein
MIFGIGSSRGHSPFVRYGLILLVSLSLLTACAKQESGSSANEAATNQATSTTILPTSRQADSAGSGTLTGPPPAFDGSRAMQYTKEIVALGPRPIGSPNHKKVEEYILSRLKGDDVSDDAFVADTPEGKFPVRNIIAKYPGNRDGIIVIASHYDTNYPLRGTSYIGANDGASSSALLLELANQLRGKKRDGYSVWLLWDDAEESMKLPWDDPDSLYGVRHLAQKWAADGTLKQIKALLLADMIGDADLDIDEDANSTPWLESVIYQAATQLGYQSHFFARKQMIEDDHMPFLQLGVPAADLIDFTYGYGNVFWHTTQDTTDKLSPKSLEIVGGVILQSIRILDTMKLPPEPNP